VWDPVHIGSGADQWEATIPIDVSGNFRGLGFIFDKKPSGPWPQVMCTESGLTGATDLKQAQWNARRMLSCWGIGSPYIIYALDNGGGDTTGYSVAPGSTPRQSYTVNQRIMQILGRMTTVSSGAPLPCVVGWASDQVPLMATTIVGNTPGNSTLFVWQRTWVNVNDGSWRSIPSPSAQPASIYVPAGLSVKECIDTITGSTVTVTGPTSNVITVPVTDNPVAIRFGP
jgi:hypothetical protein